MPAQRIRTLSIASAATLVQSLGACNPSAPSAPPASLSDCLGQQFPIKLVSRMPYLRVTIPGDSPATGDFVLDLGTNTSYIDPGAFPAAKPQLLSCKPGTPCEFQGVQVFLKAEDVQFKWADYKDRDYGIRQAGMIGTDFTSEYATTLHYSGSALFVAPDGTFCSDERLRAAGMLPMSVEGYYSSQYSKLKRIHEVLDGAEKPNDEVPNIPAIQIRMAGLDLPAQLDTGFDDRKSPFSVNVNVAWLEAVNRAHPALLRRVEDDSPVTLTTCVPDHLEVVERYKTSTDDTIPLEMLDVDGNVMRGFAATIFVKKTPPEAAKCGGIGTWKIPAAQLGASYFHALDLIVFDPFSSRVWAPAG